MCAQQLVVSAEETVVDPVLGYPSGYAKLCRNAHRQMPGLITPFTDGPPQRFLPYAAPEDEVNRILKDFDACFPIVPERDRDSPNARKHADLLWQQLDHLGNAGFNPAKFRVDPYGNVVCWHADPASPLFWEVDHWFPHSRGGKTVVSNLRIVQWQVNQRKKEKLEFLIPWWDLQLGVSVNQFLSAFGSKNSDFRIRCFSYMFLNGRNEQLNEELSVSAHVWPAAFRYRKTQYGLAPAAIVTLQKEDFLTLKSSRGVQCSTPGTSARRRWNLEEEEALRRAVQKFGPGNWKEIKDYEPALANRTTVQIKDKYRLMKGDWSMDKENVIMEKKSTVGAALQKEMQLKALREEEKRTRQAEVARLEQNLKEITEVNDKEHEALEELEVLVTDHRKEVEKQRRWAETQFSYRLCLERMIRDSLHQTAVYKEQARLNQVACNVLLAKLETQNAACQDAEEDLLKGFKQRKEMMEALPIPSSSACDIKATDVVDVSSCLSQPLDIHSLSYQSGCLKNKFQEDFELAKKGQSETTQSGKKAGGLTDDIMDSESKGADGLVDHDLEVVVVGYEYQELPDSEERVLKQKNVNINNGSSKVPEPIDSGKLNVDKWLGMLLTDGNKIEASKAGHAVDHCGSPPSNPGSEERTKGLLSGLLKKLSFKQQLERTMLKNAATKKKPPSGSEQKFKEWEDLAGEMGKIENTSSSGKNIDEEDNEVLTSACTSFDEVESEESYVETRNSAGTGTAAAEEGEVIQQRRKGISLLESLHDEEEEDVSLRPWYFQEWNARGKSGLKESLKLCSQTWAKAVKKLEVKIQDLQHHQEPE